jgi:macrolide phosphotransferase
VRTDIATLAAEHGLVVDAAGIRFSEAGLDYRVAFATANDGAEWVLRLPRRADVSAKIADEAAILDLVRPQLEVAVPDWLVRSEQLIAYPLLPGRPGLTVSDAGEPEWHFDRDSPDFARSLGRLIARLHAVEVPAGARVPVESPRDVRDGWRSALERVESAFAVSPALAETWHAWLADDGLWPDYTVFTHGELYPAHLLLDDSDRILSVLDWTTAKVGDPAIDFMYHSVLASPAAFDTAVEAYAEVAGRVPERLAERCAALFAIGPLNYALFALASGDPEHAAAAQAQLDPA